MGVEEFSICQRYWSNVYILNQLYTCPQKTKAYHRLNDDVPDAVKVRRHQELSQAFRRDTLNINQGQIGDIQLVLIEGVCRNNNNNYLILYMIILHYYNITIF